LFFAGQSHVHIQIEASQTEKELITTNPQEKKPGEIAEGSTLDINPRQPQEQIPPPQPDNNSTPFNNS
jgi:hypothetical protein